MKELVIQFGQQDGLVGTLASPVLSHVAPLALLMFNAGVIHRIGPHRAYVKIARSLQKLGVTSLRFDLSGQGDSERSASESGFEAQAVVDIRAAMSAVTQQTGIERFVLLGICSGAALSYRAALEDHRVVGCALIDIYMYPTWRTHLIRVHSLAQKTGWLKLGTAWAVRFIKGLAKSSRQGESGAVAAPAQGALPGLVKPSVAEFAEGLNSLLKRDVALYLLYTGSFLYAYNYPNQFKDRFREHRFEREFPVVLYPDMDHTLSRIAVERKFERLILEWLSKIGVLNHVPPKPHA